MQDMLHNLEALPSEADALLYEDDELDTNTCMLPLVRFIEKASGLFSSGDKPSLCLNCTGPRALLWKAFPEHRISICHKLRRPAYIMVS
jgi:hypothetical protein